ncbi:MAG: signal peptide peptidase SppA [Thermodesulfobacteriota bacterium]|nr:signal peptide peptidase SppA [Thermodesulfobacteriota bacterium]
MDRKQPIGIIVAIIGVTFIFFFIFIFLAVFWSHEERDLWAKDKIAVIKVEGIILSSEGVVKEIYKIKNMDSIKAVVLRLNSPGGGVVPSQEIYEEIMKVKRTKKIVASLGSIATSGAYYIASATHKIVANPGTITGSVGVIVESTNIEGLLKKIGVRSTVYKSAEYKDLLSPLRPASSEEKKIIQEILDNIHQQFVEAVSKGRGLDKEYVAKLANGRIFSGQQAKELNLIDELGDFKSAVNLAAKMAGIKGEPHLIYPAKKVFSLKDIFENIVQLSEKLIKNLNYNKFYLLPF